ncbi:MAG: hypothetical protein ACHQEM_07565 [Chitinophagales bacterium]
MKYVNYKGNNGERGDFKKWSELSMTHHQTINQESMNEQELIETRLWDYIDSLSNPEEKTAIEKLIEANIEWRRKYKELLDLNQLMAGSELEMPSMRFTKNVMEEIARYHVAPATKSYINKRIIWGIGIFFLVMITGFLIYGFAQVNWSAPSSGNSVIQNELNKLPKYDWSKFMSSTYTNIFMMINVVLGLILFDMYLQRKKERAKQQQI